MEKIKRVIQAYMRTCKRKGQIHEKPSLFFSTEERHGEKEFVSLRNPTHGILAVYSIHADRLKFLDYKDWPSEVKLER